MNATINNHSTAEVPAEPLIHGRPFANHQDQPAPHQEPVRVGPSHPPRAGKGGAARNLLFVIIAALVVVGLLLWQRSRTYRQLTATTAEMAVPVVSTVLPQAGPGEIEIQLPGNLMAYTEASIYARTNGYLKAWYTDIGAKVTAGQLMAEIDAPDVDAQLRQATATLAQARATLDIDQLNYNRGKQLLATRVIAQQDFDTDRTTLEAQQAAVQADEANVQDLSVEQGFQKITAPFTGVVTRRDTDVGALINAGSNTTSATAQELFHMARTDILRVYIYVPEVYSPLVRIDTPAWLELSEEPGVKVQGKVVDVAGALDPSMRTLQTEIQVPNQDGRLFPGAYATVHLLLKLTNAPKVIPINTLIFRAQGTQVGVVDSSNIVHLKKVTVGRDFGTSLEITSGVESTDRLILNPSDSLADGARVDVQNAPAAAAK
jgi:RND family efflux transporter MFP subunit